MIQLDQEEKGHSAVACIKVVGIGGAGGNTVNCMIESGFKAAEFYAVNTDAQALNVSLAGTKIQIGIKSTKGLGAGANPEIGKRAAEEDLDKVMQALGDADIVFVTGGLGGGTGSGAIPVIAQALKEKGILTIVVVTKPFLFEGKRRARITELALESVKAAADTLLIIPNQKLLEVADDKVSMIEGFGMINDVLTQSVRGISEIITRSGHINVDFADVKEIMKDKGIAIMGTARCSGQGRAKKAALEAISSPLLENMSIAGARSVLLNITGGTDLGLQEISEAASIIYEQADEDANIILGSVIDSQMGNEVAVTIIATGFPTTAPVKVQPQIQTPLQKLYAHAAVERREIVEAALKAEPVQLAAEVKKEESTSFPMVAEESPLVCLVPEEEVKKVAPHATRIEAPEEISCPLKKHLSEEEEFEQLLREEAELLARKAILSKATGREQETAVIQPEVKAVIETKEASGTQAAPAQSASTTVIDINDLDVPAFMRKHAKERRSE